MAWTPAKNVIDLTKVVDNLLAYIKAHQVEALAWANLPSTEVLPPFPDEAIYSNASGRLSTIFPQFDGFGKRGRRGRS